MKDFFNNKQTLILGLILFAIVSRLIPHANNFAPFGAIALFCSAHITNKKVGFILPLIACWISGVIINNVFYTDIYPTFTLIDRDVMWQLLSYALIFLLGSKIFNKEITISRTIDGAMASSIIFFVVTNFGTWASWPTYTKDASGLLSCYIAAVPFYPPTLIGDLIYTGVLFGSFAYFSKKSFQTNFAK